MSEQFNYATFATLRDIQLAAYMDPMLATGTVIITEQDISHLVAGLPSFDSYHLVYALEVGSACSPQTFAPLLPSYLANTDIAVVCAALNAIDRLPARHISSGLINSIRSVVPADEMKQSVAELVERLELRRKSKVGAKVSRTDNTDSEEPVR